jgi:hypothetical protein
MREFELTIDEALKKGLSPEQYLPINSQYLYQALGFRCGKMGLEPYMLGTDPLPIGTPISYVWPFPQFLTGEAYNFLIVRDPITHEDLIYSVSDDFLTVTFLFSIDELTFGLGWLMDVADFGEYAIMANGKAMLFWNTGGAWNASVGTPDTPTIPLMGTMCNLKGQLVGGNLQEAWYDCDEKSYIWSAIGSVSCVPSDDNEAGYRRDPYGGEVYHVRRLGDIVVGFSSKGITGISPVSSPTPTMGFTELSNIGLVNRGAVNGSLDRLVFIGADLVVREITKQGIKELGYYQLIKQLSGDIIVQYDPAWDDFYIGDSTKTFLLSPQGMTEVPQHPSAVWRKGPDNIYLLPEQVDATFLPAITTEIFNMGYSGLKQISIIETDAFQVTTPYTAVECSYDLTNWKISAFKPMNNQGISTVNVAGNSFKFIIVFGSLGTDFRIGYLKARYKMIDMRGIRGVYAPPPRGQANAD